MANGHISCLPYTALVSSAGQNKRASGGLLPQRPLRLRTFDNQWPLTIVHHSP